MVAAISNVWLVPMVSAWSAWLIVRSCRVRRWHQTGEWSGPWSHDFVAADPWTVESMSGSGPDNVCRRCARKQYIGSDAD